MSSSEEQLFLTLGRLEGKVDTLLALQKIQEEQIKEHDGRLRSLENSKAFAMGVSAIIGAVVSVSVTIASKLMAH